MLEQKVDFNPLPKECFHKRDWISGKDRRSFTCPECGASWTPAPGTERKPPGSTICFVTEANTHPKYVMVEI